MHESWWKRAAVPVGMVAFAALLAALAVGGVGAGNATGQRPPMVVPVGGDTILEHLPRGYARLMPVQSMDGAPATDSPAAMLATAQQLLATAARSGDARLAARADVLLARLPADAMNTDVLRVRAYSAQHRHDFGAAVQLLDRAVAADPRDAGARLGRAQVHIVRGDLDRARADCAALALGVDGGDGLLCAAALSLRTGDYAAATASAQRWLEQGGDDRDTRRHALVLRAEIAARAGADDADAWFRRALALAPDDVRSIAAYARYLRDAGRRREVLALLAPRLDNDALRLQYLLARQRSVRETSLVAQLGERYALAHRLGNPPELRDEAEYLLCVRGEPDAALALAQRNFTTQRDYEDVDLLQRAARAARRPDALAPLQAWARAQRLRLSEPAGDSC